MSMSCFLEVIFMVYKCNVSLYLVAILCNLKLYVEKEFECKWLYMNASAMLWTCYKFVMIFDESERKERKGNDCTEDWNVLKIFSWPYECEMVPELMGGGSHLIWSAGSGSFECTIVYQVMSIS